MNLIKNLLKENDFSDNELRLVACDFAESFLYSRTDAFEFIDKWDLQEGSGMRRGLLDRAIKLAREYARGEATQKDMEEAYVEAAAYSDNWIKRVDGWELYICAMLAAHYTATEKATDAIERVIRETYRGLTFAYLEADLVFWTIKLKEEQTQIVQRHAQIKKENNRKAGIRPPKRPFIEKEHEEPDLKPSVLSLQSSGFLVGLNTSLLLLRNENDVESCLCQVIQDVRDKEYEELLLMAVP